MIRSGYSLGELKKKKRAYEIMIEKYEKRVDYYCELKGRLGEDMSRLDQLSLMDAKESLRFTRLHYSQTVDAINKFEQESGKQLDNN